MKRSFLTIFLTIAFLTVFGQMPELTPKVTFQVKLKKPQNGIRVKHTVTKDLANNQWSYTESYTHYDKYGRVALVIFGHHLEEEADLDLDTTKYDYDKSSAYWTKKQTGKAETIRKIEFDSEGRMSKVFINGELSYYYQYKNNNINKIWYSEGYWDEYEYDDSNRVVKKTKYKSSEISEIFEYTYEHRSTVIYKKQIFDYNRNDTSISKYTYVYSEDSLHVKTIVEISEYGENFVEVLSFRYHDGKMIQITDCTTNTYECSYEDIQYNDNGDLIKSSVFLNSGLKNISETTNEFEYFKK